VTGKWISLHYCSFKFCITWPSFKRFCGSRYSKVDPYSVFSFEWYLNYNCSL